MVVPGRPCSGSVRSGLGQRDASRGRWPAPSGLRTADRPWGACAAAAVAAGVPGVRRGGRACGARPGERRRAAAVLQPVGLPWSLRRRRPGPCRWRRSCGAPAFICKQEGRLSQSSAMEVKQIEKRDSVLTSKNQIERLTRPGSSYFNLNPFEVLQIDPEVTDEEIKKRFRQLSILVHPDKNQDDADRAQKAFEAVDKAYKLLLDQEQKKRALDVIQAGKEYVEHTVKERKKQLKKEGKPTNVEEDDPELFKQAVYKQTMKLFAELEIKRKEREAKEMHERKRQREEEIEAQEKAKREREWQKNFEESRDGRVDSWRNFQANTKGKKEKKNRTFLRPPKVKMEQRE
ncbi:DnaJ heat shock protein family (Hsp40) member C8 [Cricetulus griseus]